MSRPSRRIAPASGRSKPAIIRRSVVLPQPEGPSRVKNSPVSMVMLTRSTAVSAPKRRVTFLISRSAMVLGASAGADQRPGESKGKDEGRDSEQPVARPLRGEQLIERALDAVYAIVGERAMQQARELRQHRRPAGRLAAHRAQQALQADLLAHPFLQERFCRLPQIEVGVELPPQAF